MIVVLELNTLRMCWISSRRRSCWETLSMKERNAMALHSLSVKEDLRVVF